MDKRQYTNYLLDGASYGAQTINLEPATIDALKEPEQPKIKLNRQNRQRLRHDNRRLVQRVLAEAKVSKLRQFWAEMFPAQKKVKS